MQILILVISMSIFYLCIKILITRIIDVTLGTLRTIITVKDKILLASIIGFFEVLIWFLIAKEALEKSNSILIGIFYAPGFAAGTYIGGIISRKIIKSHLEVQIITDKMTQDQVDELRKEGFAISIMNINVKKGKPDKFMMLLEINNKDLLKLQKLVKIHDKEAFIIVNESKQVINGYLSNK